MSASFGARSTARRKRTRHSLGVAVSCGLLGDFDQRSGIVGIGFDRPGKEGAALFLEHVQLGLGCYAGLPQALDFGQGHPGPREVRVDLDGLSQVTLGKTEDRE